jgi:hypothetical protein
MAVTIYFKKTKRMLFLLPGIDAENLYYSVSTPETGVEIVHVIAKNFNPVNRTEFNPGVESSPCNRPLKVK